MDHRKLLLGTVLAGLVAACGPPADEMPPALARKSRDDKTTVLQLVAAVNRRDLDAMRGLVTPDFVRHTPAAPGGETRGPEGLVALVSQGLEAFPQPQVAIERMIAEMDIVAFWGTLTGTQDGPLGPFPATGRKATVNATGMFRLRDGKISEMWITWDNASGMTQLGHTPAPDRK